MTVVVPKAEFLDANTSREFRDELPAALGAGGKVVLDLRHVQFMDSGGCGAVLAVLKKLKASGGNLKICCVTNPVRALFDLVVPGYVQEGKSYLTIGIGCTGGRHRSVVVADELAGYFRDRGLAAAIDHRDLERG